MPFLDIYSTCGHDDALIAKALSALRFKFKNLKACFTFKVRGHLTAMKECYLELIWSTYFPVLCLETYTTASQWENMPKEW